MLAVEHCEISNCTNSKFQSQNWRTEGCSVYHCNCYFFFWDKMVCTACSILHHNRNNINIISSTMLFKNSLSVSVFKQHLKKDCYRSKIMVIHHRRLFHLRELRACTKLRLLMQILLKFPALSFNALLVPASPCLLLLDKSAFGSVQPWAKCCCKPLGSVSEINNHYMLTLLLQLLFNTPLLITLRDKILVRMEFCSVSVQLCLCASCKWVPWCSYSVKTGTCPTCWTCTLFIKGRHSWSQDCLWHW